MYADFTAVGEIRSVEKIAGQDLLDRLGVDLDPRDRGVERGGADVVEAGSAGADEHDLPGDGVRIEAVLQDRPCRNVAGRLVLGEPHPKATLGIGRYLELPDPDETDTGVLAERPDPACARRLDDVGRRPLRDPQRLGRKRRIERVLQRQEQGHVSDHLIAVRRRVDGAVAAGRRLQHRQIRDRIAEVAHEKLRIVAGDREGGLLLRDARRARPAGLRLERRAGQGPCGQRVRGPPSVALKRSAVRHGGAGLGLGQNEPGHHRGLLDGGGENAVVRRQDSHRVPKREHLEQSPATASAPARASCDPVPRTRHQRRSPRRRTR